MSESDGSLVVPLVLSGQTQSQSFSVVVIAEADNSSLLSPARGNAIFMTQFDKEGFIAFPTAQLCVPM